jgi:hypothetical protein
MPRSPFLVYAVATIALGACATGQPASPPPAPVGTDLYQVGPVRVLLRPQPEVEFMCRLQTQQRVTSAGQIFGCYVPREQAIISTPDPYVLLHEFKHYFEGPFHD